MRVFRLENQDGVGPYAGSNVSIFRPPWLTSFDRFAYEPENDGIPNYPLSSVFGCKTLPDLFDWFGNDQVLRQLKYAGYYVKEIEVSDDSEVLVGGSQVAFDRNTITMHTMMDWNFVEELRNVYASKKLGLPTSELYDALLNYSE